MCRAERVDMCGCRLLLGPVRFGAVAVIPGGELLRAGCLGAVAEGVCNLGKQVLELL
jgi:hypothetical protein